jgi:hypothetical protein
MPALKKHTYLTSTQEVVFHLPLHVELPSILFTINEEDFANVLQSASKIIDFQKQSAFHAQQDIYIKERVQSNLVEKDQEIQALKKQIEKLAKSKDEDIHEQIEKSKSLQFEIEKLKTKLDTISSTVSEQAEKRVDDIRMSKDNHISDLKESINSLLAEKKTLEVQLHEKALSAGKSQKKGTQGELFFQELAKDAIGWNLTIISKSEHTTDLRLNHLGVQAFFEVKNYKEEKPPSHDQYKKFLNDMNLHSEADIGFYISLKTDIPYYEDLTIEWTASHQMLVIIPRFLEYDMQTLFRQFELYLGVVKKIRLLLSKIQVTDTDTTKLERITTYIQNMLKRVDRAKKDYDILRKQLQSSVDSMRQHVETFFDAQLKEINSTLAILGDAEQEETIPVTNTEVVESLPNLVTERKKRKPTKSAKQPGSD